MYDPLRKGGGYGGCTLSYKRFNPIALIIRLPHQKPLWYIFSSGGSVEISTEERETIIKTLPQVC